MLNILPQNDAIELAIDSLTLADEFMVFNPAIALGCTPAFFGLEDSNQMVTKMHVTLVLMLTHELLTLESYCSHLVHAQYRAVLHLCTTGTVLELFNHTLYSISVTKIIGAFVTRTPWIDQPVQIKAATAVSSFKYDLLA